MVMSALIQYPEGLTVRKLATITGYAKGGGGFRGALSKLRTAGYIEGRDHLVATDAGRAALPDVEPMPTGQALLDHWLGQMKRRAEREVLIAICEAWPNTITPEEVAAKTDYEVGGGGFRGALSKLRTLDLIEGRGDLRASDDLFTTHQEAVDREQTPGDQANHDHDCDHDCDHGGLAGGSDTRSRAEESSDGQAEAARRDPDLHARGRRHHRHPRRDRFGPQDGGRVRRNPGRR
jgi:hypothetical protein